MQFLFLRDIKPHVILLLTSMLLFTAGCEDDDHDDHDHDEEHTDAEGFVLEDESGTEVYREFEGAMNGTVTLAVGDTLELSVHFLDHDGDEIEHEEGEEDEDHEDGIEVSGFNSSIAVVEAEDHEEEGDHDHEEEHGMAIHVIGVSSGSTSFQLQLMHEGHADYTSTNNVPVTVN
tara:strand:- start:436 stop:960 length:525 start_codon:yes stop_codon:yes gene_type:complete